MQKSITKSIMEMEECQTQNILQILLQMTTFFVDMLKLKLTKDQLVNCRMCVNKTFWQCFQNCKNK